MTPDKTQLLLADDNDANRLIARTILERSGYSVTTAQNGSHALALAKLAHYDLIVLDIMMPVMDGMRALRRLRRDKNPNQNTPVFALTAYCSAQDRQRYLMAGFNSVLSKPLRPGDMKTALKRFHDKKALPIAKPIDVLSTANVPLLDTALIAELSEISDPIRLGVIQSRYWKSVEEKCVTIKKSLPDALRGDGAFLSQFRRAVHAVKGASAAIGLSRVAHISRRLQNAPPSEIPSLMEIFVDSLTESRPALTQALSRTGELDTAMEMSGEDEAEAAHHSQNNRAAI